MKKVISLLLAILLIVSMMTVAVSAYSVSDEGIPSAAEVVKAYEEENEEELEKQRIYFQMPDGKRGSSADKDVYVSVDELDPETGEVIGTHDELVLHAGDKAPSWYSDYNIVDGQHYAGAYWWGGPGAADTWCGYRAEIEDYEQGIYYVDLPKDVVIMIWNNGVDGGMDSSQPIYYEAAQSGDTNVEGAYEGDFDTLPYGSPDPDYFDGCIFIVDPNNVDINPLSHKQTCGLNPYVYYGNGCYGGEFKEGKGDTDYPDGTDNWSDDMQDVCKNPDHFKNGVHVGYQGGDVHTHTPETVAAVPATTEADGVKAHYKCTGCDKLFLDEECTQEVTAADLVIPKFVPDPNLLYFDANSTGWEMGAKNKIAFNIFGGDLTNALDWGSKKLIGTAVSGYDGIFSFDPTKVKYTLNPGVQYKIIFARTEGNNWTNQTFDLFFTVDCLGHVAYCTGKQYENPVDSSKKTLAAFWKGMDESKYGPVLQVSSIGNVVGTCPEAGKTPEDIFVDFLTVINEKTETTMYANAYHYVVEPGTKTEQKMIDDIGKDLGLTKQQVYDAFTNNEIETTWDWTVSTLPGTVTPAHTHTPGEPVRENEKPASCTVDGSYDEVVYCTGCNEELSRETKVIKAEGHKPGKAVNENVKAATCTAAGSYEAVVYCTVCNTELSRTTKTIAKKAHTLSHVAEVPATETATGTKAHYKCSVCKKLFSDEAGKNEVTAASLIIPMLAHTHTPATAVRENVKAATCTAAGSYDEVVYCTSCGAELSRTTKTIAKKAHTISYVAEVPATEKADGVKAHYECSVCHKLFSDKAGKNEVTAASLVIPKLAHTHTPGAAVQENVKPATCKAAGSYDEVVYCTGCHEELSRTTKTITKLEHTPGKAVRENIVKSTCTTRGSYDDVVYCTECGEELSRTHGTIAKKAHTISFVAEVPATTEATGVKAHYECSVCHKLFSDAEGKTEVTAASLVIPKLPVVREGILGDFDNSGEVDIIDVVLIQRAAIKLVAPDSGMVLRGDVNGDGELNSVDATLIQRYLVGLSAVYAIGEQIK